VKKHIVLFCLLLAGCENPGNLEKKFQKVKKLYPVNTFLTQDVPVWSGSANQGNIILQARFKEQLEIKEIVKGNWCHYLYKITYDHIRILEGSWNEEEISFFCRDAWPTRESGIMLKRPAWPFRENEDLVFELITNDELYEIVSHYPPPKAFRQN
jgi:hypothetical protein